MPQMANYFAYSWCDGCAMAGRWHSDGAVWSKFGVNSTKLKITLCEIARRPVAEPPILAEFVRSDDAAEGFGMNSRKLGGELPWLSVKSVQFGGLDGENVRYGG